MWMAILKPYITGKYREVKPYITGKKNSKSNNPPKYKRILKTKYKA